MRKTVVFSEFLGFVLSRFKHPILGFRVFGLAPLF